MRTKRLWALASVLLVAGLAVAQSSTPPPAEKLLTTADVEKVSGLKGIKVVPRNPRVGAGGDLNFARADGNLLVMAIIRPADPLWKQWQQALGFGEKVGDLGDEAFEGRDAPNVLFVRKGNRAISLSSFFDPELVAQGKMKPLLTQTQLRELAMIIVSRL